MAAMQTSNTDSPSVTRLSTSKQYGDESNPESQNKMSLDFIAPGAQRLYMRKRQPPDLIKSPLNPSPLRRMPCTSDQRFSEPRALRPQSGDVAYRPVPSYCRIAPMRKDRHVDTSHTSRLPDPYHRVFRFYNRDGVESRSPAPPDADRAPKVCYGEDERAFIIACKVLRGMKWHDIGVEFNAWFPPGQKRRNQGVGVPPFYPPRARTARNLLQLYYRICKAWDLSRIRTGSEEDKQRIRAFVVGKILRMYHLPEIQQLARGYRI